MPQFALCGRKELMTRCKLNQIYHREDVTCMHIALGDKLEVEAHKSGGRPQG
jgi:hypothetical protein